MSEEPVLSDYERLDILKQISESKVSSPNATTSGDEKGANNSAESFGTLLEKSLANREKADKEEDNSMDELRNKVISESRLDLIKDLIRF